MREKTTFGVALRLRRLLGPVLREHPVRDGAKKDGVQALDEGELLLDERTGGRVGGRPGLGDEVELAVRARGEAVECHELLDDDLAHLVEAIAVLTRASLHSGQRTAAAYAASRSASAHGRLSVT